MEFLCKQSEPIFANTTGRDNFSLLFGLNLRELEAKGTGAVSAQPTKIHTPHHHTQVMSKKKKKKKKKKSGSGGTLPTLHRARTTPRIVWFYDIAKSMYA